MKKLLAMICCKADLIRRGVLLSLVALCASLIGCATVDTQCDMKADYKGEAPIALHGTVQLSWDFGVTPDCGTSITYGCTKCRNGACFITLREQPPSFNDVCGLARFAHEFLEHGMGMRHDGA